MKVPGFSRTTFSPPSLPSQHQPWNRLRQVGKSCVAAIESSAMKPTLCRLSAYCAPGLPRPTNSFMSHPSEAGESPPRRGLFLLLVLLLLVLLRLVLLRGALGTLGRSSLSASFRHNSSSHGLDLFLCSS